METIVAFIGYINGNLTCNMVSQIEPEIFMCSVYEFVWK